MTHLVDQILAKLKDDLTESLSTCDTDHSLLISTIFERFEDPFATLSTAALQESYIKSNFPYVAPFEVELGKEFSRKRSKGQKIIYQKSETFYYVPILESLKVLLSNKMISRLVIKHSNFCAEGTYYDICDGSIFRNDTFFQEHPDALAIVLYHDEIEVCNPLGSHATTHKLDMYYYTLANISPVYRSKHLAVRLVAIANSKLVKKYGIEKIMEPVIDDALLLNNGFDLNVEGHNEIYGRVFI